MGCLPRLLPLFLKSIRNVYEPLDEAPCSKVSLAWASRVAAIFLACFRVLMRPLASLLLVILVAGFDDVAVVRGALLAALDFVHGSLHVVVDATLGDTRQRLERSRMLIG